MGAKEIIADTHFFVVAASHLEMELTFGLNISNSKSQPKKSMSKSIFDEDEDDEAVKPFRPLMHREAAPVISKASVLSAEGDVDPDIYDYDAHYDKINSYRQARLKQTQSAAKDRRPRYMDDILAATQQRKKEQQIVEERMIQRQRDAEGDEFNDKERFVTDAYKHHMEELKQHDELQKKRDGMIYFNGKLRLSIAMNQGKDITGFYRRLLDERTALNKVGSNDQPQEPLNEEPSEKEIIQAALASGKRITLNADQQVVDKRELLSAGLNVSKRSSQLAFVSHSSNYHSNRYNTKERGSSIREENSRVAHELERQWEERERKRLEAEEKEKEELKTKMAKRSTDETVSAARARYLQRLNKKDNVKLAENSA